VSSRCLCGDPFFKNERQSDGLWRSDDSGGREGLAADRADPFPATDDALLTRLIAAASEFIQNWLGRQIAGPSWLEIRRTHRRPTLAFATSRSPRPCLSIDGLMIPPASAIGGFGAWLHFHPDRAGAARYVFTRRPQNVIGHLHRRIRRDPARHREACIELVCLRHRERTRIGEVSKSLGGGETVTFFAKGHARRRENPPRQYRAVAPASGFARRLAPTATVLLCSSAL